MARYILIKRHSGFVWGDSADLQGRPFVGTPTEFAQALDESYGEFGRQYDEQPFATDHGDADGYLVFAPPADFPVVHDDDSRAGVTRVDIVCAPVCFIAVSQAEADNG